MERSDRDMILFLLVAWIICGLVAAGVWQSKGGSYAAGFWLGALLGFLGLFYVAFAQPEGRGSSSGVTYAGGTDLTRRRAPTTKTCPRCAEEVKAAAVVCRFCGNEFPTHVAVPDPQPEPEVFDGDEVSDVREHAFGVRWGKTPNGDVVYRESQGRPWVVFDKAATSLVPPPGYFVQGKASPLT